MLKKMQPIVQDFFSFLKNDLVEVLECLSHREPWQDHMMGYELPEHSEDVEFNNGVMIFMNTASYHEIVMDNLDFYSCLEEICMEYVTETPEQKAQVYLLLDKVKTTLNL